MKSGKSQFGDIFNSVKPNVVILAKSYNWSHLKVIVYRLRVPNFMVHSKVLHGELIS